MDEGAEEKLEEIHQCLLPLWAELHKIICANDKRAWQSIMLGLDYICKMAHKYMVEQNCSDKPKETMH